ncbi:MAG: YbaB/EbfC family nucleoid-associated protein [Parasphingorhabdus sp.]|uniref:YbaB/EbfC family nucleoid-associated protein n=1 Tax=Parasphingorhabdus sp. TaxID=2709688 RepID=UPI003299130B
MKSMEEMIQAAQEAAQTVQAQMEEAQTKLDSIEVEGQSGGGLVSVKATAKGRILGVKIDESLMKAEEKGILEDLVAAAFNDARDKADAVSNEEMGKMTGGMGLPAGFKLPF